MAASRTTVVSINARVNVPSFGSASRKIFENRLYSILEGVRNIGKDFYLVLERRSYRLFIRCAHIFGEHSFGKRPVVFDPSDRQHGGPHKL